MPHLPNQQPSNLLDRLSFGKLLFTILFSWTFVALLFSGFGYLAAIRRGAAQPWWPSFGYALAVFSIWALMTLPIAWFVAEVERRIRSWWARLAIYIFGLPGVCVLHVFAFAELFWPIYNDDGRIPTRWAMGERMLLGNLDTNALFYVGLVGVFTLLLRKQHAAAAERPEQSPEKARDEALTIRSRGGFVRVPLDTIDRIEAAGDYCEVHDGQSAHLLNETLVSLESRLPASWFARVHRSSIIALDRVASVSGIGRGDALITLRDGTEIRLSRRYRSEFERRLAIGRQLVGGTVPLTD